MSTGEELIKEAFKGVKVLDFSWIVAGPVTTRYLADFGATVIKIESSLRPDRTRTNTPYAGKQPGLNRSGYFMFFNANKYSMALNLVHPRGREIAKKLVAWADVVVENFNPGTMEAWGLGYQDLNKINHDIIMLSLSIQGQTGPHAQHSGYGVQLTGFAGFTSITGWPDRHPAQPFGAYTDFVAPYFGAAALVAALDYRNKTGTGQYLDLSQFEASLHFLSPLILNYFCNRKESPRNGNRSDRHCPHGVYRCRGDDAWCAVSINNDSEWKAFCLATGSPGWAINPLYDTFENRKNNEDELDKLVESWTIKYPVAEVVSRLQRYKVASGQVLNAKGLLEDPQLGFRNSFWKMEHKEMGSVSHLGTSFILSETPAAARMPAPCLGEHTQYVCQEILGMSDEEFMELYNSNVLQ